MSDTATETTFAPLTADDIAALRSAESVTFHHYQGRGFIRADLDRHHADEPRIYSAREQRLFPRTDRSERTREITVDANAHGYVSHDGPWWALHNSPNVAAFHMIHHPKSNEEWKTIVGLLRRGDLLRLDWSAGNDTENHRDAGFHADELRVTVKRGESVMVFLLAYSVGPDNSARMIRRHG